MKIVMVVNNELPLGLAVNTAAVLGISLGGEKKEIIGPDCMDGSTILHKGITKESIPMLAADGENIKSIYQKCISNPDVDVIDFSKTAQGCRRYSEYSSKLEATANSDLEFSGICLSGPKKEIDKLTGSLGLYR